MRYPTRSLPRLVSFFAPFLLIAVLATTSGCAKKITQAELEATPWEISASELVGPSTDAIGRKKEVPSPLGFFRFYPDGQATMVTRGTFHLGKWSWSQKDGQILFEGNNKVREQIIVERAHTGDPSHKFLFELTSNDPAVLFAVTADDHAYTDLDIYSPSANAWRIPAKEAQTNEEIARRMQAMLAYLRIYFQSAAIRDAARIEIASLPTPFLFASNGVALYNRDNLPQNWIKLFATIEEAEDATALLSGLFDNVEVPQTPSRFERNSLIFHQLSRNLQATLDASQR